MNDLAKGECDVDASGNRKILRAGLGLEKNLGLI